MCIGVCRKIKNTLFPAERFHAKPRSVAEVRASTLSTEIICRSGFFSGFAVTSRVSPIHRIFTQRIYITKSSNFCQAFKRSFFKNFFEIARFPLFLPFYRLKTLISDGFIPFRAFFRAFFASFLRFIARSLKQYTLFLSFVAFFTPLFSVA